MSIASLIALTFIMTWAFFVLGIAVVVRTWETFGSKYFVPKFSSLPISRFAWVAVIALENSTASISQRSSSSSRSLSIR